MTLAPYMIFLASFAFNLAALFGLRFIGRFRLGLDSLLFCAIATGYTGGIKSGLAYGLLVAVLFYVFSGHWEHAMFVIPLNGIMGVLAGLLQSLPLFWVALIVMVIYHAASFLITTYLLHRSGLGYALFVAVNAATTFALFLLAQPFM